MRTWNRLGILLSGRGSNFLAIADSVAAGPDPGAEIAVVISNLADALGIAAARERGLNAVAIEGRGRKRAEHDAAILAALSEQHAVELVCLAGYMRLLSPVSFTLSGPHSEYPSVAASRVSGSRCAATGL